MNRSLVQFSRPLQFAPGVIEAYRRPISKTHVRTIILILVASGLVAWRFL